MQVKGKDGTTTQPDVTLGAEKAGTPRTFTQEEHDKAVRDAKTAALADIGRLQKASADSLKAAQDAQARVNQMIAEQDRRELEEAEGDSQRLSALQERQARRKAESELAMTKQELAQKNELIQQTEMEKVETKRAQIVREVATDPRFNVDPVRLARLAKATDGSVEAIEDLAKDLPTGTPKTSLKPDSGDAIGGHVGREKIIADYTKDPRNWASRERYFELRREEGR